jgi:hypothetical protein
MYENALEILGIPAPQSDFHQGKIDKRTDKTFILLQEIFFFLAQGMNIFVVIR